ncbi:tat pathway signal sequence protein [Rutstroemia sp. NJR-2017a BVV2]|nr:tat pathway signal sequence protein [Rutstroemia sp. NJR-2017a BVV2]
MYTPVQEIIQYIPVQQSNSLHYHNPFMANPATGLPDHTTDDKWQMLYNESMHTSIPPSLADRLPLKTLPIPSDPSKYLIQLEIYHQLHCLNSIRQALWLDGVEHYRLPHFKDFYLPGGRRNYTGHGAKHLDWIRQSLLCNGDTTPVSWQWDSVAKIPLPQLPETKICKNMDAIDEWTRMNAVEEPVDFGFGPDIDL